jgi:hypothetical protein
MDELKRRLQESRLKALEPVVSEVLHDVELHGYSMSEFFLVLSQYAHQRGFSNAVELLEEAATAAYREFYPEVKNSGEMLEQISTTSKGRSGFQ